MTMTTWAIKIADAMADRGDDPSHVVAVAASETFDFDREFNDGYGAVEGDPFTIWTEKWVYFPATHDGVEWIASVPRNPCAVITDHVGGQ